MTAYRPDQQGATATAGVAALDRSEDDVVVATDEIADEFADPAVRFSWMLPQYG